ncbi:hypothetical protein A3F34_01995 [Candidatus Roizmanbacteria bacterium RIFCSPHIGHO2_12_FULL_44_10]|uniref:Uncharacterized protein n=2 Tax=Patescibacteria group TaxID=1783273 RepID=A0A1F7I698_9BACT|nr:MAG: hypothetical protein A3F34_01995 [Candidatus Roizmanbacteria bacterium RIFCSPHIGHO2_12_FULL_44_10]OGN34363.1 MAG: hypothetical protein A3I39_02050 [Candidatus Yanofskybacteria bacterium RIFCSPLOWO2_02_FULL_47_9b]
MSEKTKPDIKRGLSDQLAHLPDYETRQLIASGFFNAVTHLISHAEIPMIEFSFRAKTDERIRLKARYLKATRWTRPMFDIYAARVVVPDGYETDAVSAILDSFGADSRYKNPFPNYWQHRSGQRRSNRSVGLSDYSAWHVRVAFGGNLVVPHIGEIQIFNPTEFAFQEATRDEYEQRRDERYRAVLGDLW